MGMGERHRDGEGGRGSIAAAAAGRDLEGNLNPCQASEEGRKGPSLLLSFVRLICMTPFPPRQNGILPYGAWTTERGGFIPLL